MSDQKRCEFKDAVSLISVHEHKDMNTTVVTIHEATEALGEIGAGILIADIARNLEQAFGWDLKEIMVTFQREMEQPTDIPVQPS